MRCAQRRGGNSSRRKLHLSQKLKSSIPIDALRRLHTEVSHLHLAEASDLHEASLLSTAADTVSGGLLQDHHQQIHLVWFQSSRWSHRQERPKTFKLQQSNRHQLSHGARLNLRRILRRNLRFLQVWQVRLKCTSGAVICPLLAETRQDWVLKVRSGHPPQRERLLLLRLDCQGLRGCAGRVGAALPGPRARTGGPPSPGATPAGQKSRGPGGPPDSSPRTTWTAVIRHR